MAPVTDSLTTVLDAYVGLDVLVVGEAFLDGWLYGAADRLSREAPVPVVTVDDRDYAPGGAANTAANAAALGAQVRFLSVVGSDDDGRLLRAALRQRHVRDDDVLIDRHRRTAAKRRVLAGDQILLRYDEGDTGPLSIATVTRLLTRLEHLAPLVDVIVVGDYDAGLFDERVLDRLATLVGHDGAPLVVDARHPTRWARVRPRAIKPNFDEAAGLLPAGLPHGPPTGTVSTGTVPTRQRAPSPRAERVLAAGDRLLAAGGAAVLAVTLDTEGVVVLDRTAPAHVIPAVPAPQTRAAGAGDSFTAAFALAVALGVPAATAGELGAAAAASVVRRAGTAVCTAAALHADLRHAELERAASGDATAAPLLDVDGLAPVVAAYRDEARRIVFTNGCFDVLHRGHVRHLHAARELGDVLVVGLNSDASLRRLTGRTGNPLADRAAVLAALSCVDAVAVFDGDTPADLLELVRPEIYVKGGDYTPAMLSEAPLVERLGGQVRILDYEEDRRPLAASAGVARSLARPPAR